MIIVLFLELATMSFNVISSALEKIAFIEKLYYLWRYNNFYNNVAHVVQKMI